MNLKSRKVAVIITLLVIFAASVDGKRASSSSDTSSKSSHTSKSIKSCKSSKKSDRSNDVECNEIDQPEYGEYVMIGDGKVGSLAVFICNGQAVHDNGSLVTIECTCHGTWTISNAATCPPVCENPPAIIGGYYSLPSSTSALVQGTTATITCEDGYYLDGEQHFECATNIASSNPPFKWTPSLTPTCKDCCRREYTKVFANSETGAILMGNKLELLVAANSGASVKIFAPDKNTLYRPQFLRQDDGELCAQVVLDIVPGQTYTLENREFTVMCTDGSGSVVRTYPVGDEVKAQPVATSNLKLEWFVRPLCDGPVLEENSDGTTLSGSTSSVVNAVQNGYDVTIQTMCSKNIVAANNLVHNPVTAEVSMQSIWQIGQTENFPTLPERPVFLINIWSSTSGLRDRHIVRVGRADQRPPTNDEHNTRWFVDPCWTLVYRHDTSGTEIAGSLSALVNGIFNGQRVKALINIVGNEMLLEPSEIKVWNNVVTAIFTDEVGNDGNPNTIRSDPTWVYRILNTLGGAGTASVLVEGSTVVVSPTYENKEITWFLGTKPWAEVVSLDDQSNIESGQVTDLADAVKGGANVRYMEKPINEDYYAFKDADKVTITSSGDVEALHVRGLHLKQEVSDSTFKFGDPSTDLYWRFTVTSTGADHLATAWKIGSHDLLGSPYNYNAETKWFISV